ncbi:uncharacterized protein LOC121489109 [Vulpes lagopus]|uniref:uncharacterized protein LOC121489109 n=1 Tax=Vulpes lagopus TaxID=494514 RepID=UPI001BC9891F|nr:uncharacterized protein LOC121489109 [Vulpes lagopus]
MTSEEGQTKAAALWPQVSSSGLTVLLCRASPNCPLHLQGSPLTRAVLPHSTSEAHPVLGPFQDTFLSSLELVACEDPAEPKLSKAVLTEGVSGVSSTGAQNRRAPPDLAAWLQVCLPGGLASEFPHTGQTGTVPCWDGRGPPFPANPRSGWSAWPCTLGGGGGAAARGSSHPLGRAAGGLRCPAFLPDLVLSACLGPTCQSHSLNLPPLPLALGRSRQLASLVPYYLLQAAPVRAPGLLYPRAAGIRLHGCGGASTRAQRVAYHLVWSTPAASQGSPHWWPQWESA